MTTIVPGLSAVCSMKLFHSIFVSFALMLFAASSWALPFGAFDPSALALGGAGVALASGANAPYFNPAMLARYSVRKELGKNSHLVFPVVSTRYSEALKDVNDFRTSDLDTNLSTAINTFNTTSSTANAQSVLNASIALQDGLDKVSGSPLDFDTNVGFVIGIPSKHQGGAIIYNKRLVGDGLIEQTAADRALLNAYVEALSFVTSGGTQGAAHPELIDAGGNLIDPTGSLTSSARATAVLLTEIGMSFAGEVQLFHRSFNLGVTPKYVKVDTYDLSTTATNSNLSTSGQRINDWGMNLDLGAEKQFSPHWRAGMVLKNLVSRDYDTELGNQVHVGPQWRAGVAWLRDDIQLGVDLDLTRNRAVGAGDDSQVLAFGGSWRLGHSFELLGGMQRNLKATGDQKELLYSAGLQATWYKFQSVLSYAYSGVERAIGVRTGFRF